MEKQFYMCEHDWFYLGGHNEWWVCRKCGRDVRSRDRGAAMNNHIWAVCSEDGGAVIAIFNDRDKAIAHIKEHDEDEWWYLAFYNGDTGRYMGKQDRSSGLW